MSTVSLILYYSDEEDKKKIIYDAFTYSRDMKAKPIIDFENLHDKVKDKFYLLRIKDEYNSYQPLWDFFLKRGHKIALFVDPNLIVLTPSFVNINYLGFVDEKEKENEDDNHSPYQSDGEYGGPPGYERLNKKKRVTFSEKDSNLCHAERINKDYPLPPMAKVVYDHRTGLVQSDYGARIARAVEISRENEKSSFQNHPL